MRRDDQGRRLCTATKQNGEPCRGAALKGATVCRVHGGAAPQVKAAAHRRLMEAVDPIVAELIRLATGAKAERDRIVASRAVLDYVNIGALLAEGFTKEDVEELHIPWPERRW